MNSMFFYGTLRHVPLLECVLARSADDIDFSLTTLRDYAAYSGPEGLYPVLRESLNADTKGIVVRGLTTEDVERLNYYEGGFDYTLRRVTLTSGEQADVYVPGPLVSHNDAVWDLSAWTHRWADMTVWAAEEAMDGFGKLSAEEVAHRFPRIRARAWSKVLAQSGRHGQGVLDGRVDVVSRSRVHTNFFAMDELVLRHETFGGEMSDRIERAVFVSSDAAIVLPYDPVRDRVLLVEQIRLGPVGRNDPVQWQMEPVAGLIDPGETAEEAARREGAEEAGLEFQVLEPVGECYASPGAATDFFHMFVGLCNLPDGSAGIGGQEDEGENIRSHLLSFPDLLTMADDRRVANAPLALLTYWLARHRARLRATV